MEKLDEEAQRIARFLFLNSDQDLKEFYGRVKACEDKLKTAFESSDGLNTPKLIQIIEVFNFNERQRMYVTHNFTKQFFMTAHIEKILKAGNENRD